MGYYTYYTCEVINKSDVAKSRIVEAVKTLADIYGDSYKIEHLTHKNLENMINPFEAFFDEEMRWYNYPDDMAQLSRLFPEMIFRLYGEGEDREDTWEHYFHNDKDERINAEIVFPPAPAWATL